MSVRPEPSTTPVPTSGASHDTAANSDRETLPGMLFIVFTLIVSVGGIVVLLIKSLGTG